MKGNSITLALLKKEAREFVSQFRKGNFDLMGFLLKVILSLALMVIFVVFFKRFSDIYLAIPLDGKPQGEERLFELLSLVSFALFVCFAIAGASKLSQKFFAREDLKLLSALPVRSGAVYAAGMISSYASLLPVSALIVLPTYLILSPTGSFLLKSLAVVFLLPLLSLAAGALLSLPYHAIVRFLKKRYVLALILATLLAASGFYLYAKLLGGVKDLLLHDDLKYFFNETRMTFLRTLSFRLYPGVFFAEFSLKAPLRPFLWIIGLCGVGILLSIFSVGAISHFMQAPESMATGGGRKRTLRAKSPFFSLLFKEWKEILRSPAYAFSCFSMAAILPLMVYFCMSAGDSLVKRVVGMDCSAELALFLTLIFGSLSNVFCSTNISREGERFYLLKAMPLTVQSVFGSKIFFCLAVSALAQSVSAAVLYITGYVSAGMSVFLFFCGTLFSFAQICFATKYDFLRAKFSTEEEASASEAGGTASAVILVGMLSSFAVGGISLLVKLLTALKFKSGANLLYYSGAAVFVLSALGFVYLVRRLKKQYREFSGGGLI